MKLIMENWRNLISEKKNKESEKERLYKELNDVVEECAKLVKKLKTPQIKNKVVKKMTAIWFEHDLKFIPAEVKTRLKTWEKISNLKDKVKIQNEATNKLTKIVLKKLEHKPIDWNKKRKKDAKKIAGEGAAKEGFKQSVKEILKQAIKAGSKTATKTGNIVLVVPAVIIGIADYKIARRKGLNRKLAATSAALKVIPGVEIGETLNTLFNPDTGLRLGLDDIFKEVQTTPRGETATKVAKTKPFY